MRSILKLPRVGAINFKSIKGSKKVSHIYTMRVCFNVSFVIIVLTFPNQFDFDISQYHFDATSDLRTRVIHPIDGYIDSSSIILFQFTEQHFV